MKEEQIETNIYVSFLERNLRSVTLVLCYVDTYVRALVAS